MAQITIPPKDIWTHKPSGRSFWKKEDYKNCLIEWRRAYGDADMSKAIMLLNSGNNHAYRSLLMEIGRKHQEELKIQREEIAKKLNPVVAKKEGWRKLREQHVSYVTKETMEKISFYEREIQKMKLVKSLLRKAIVQEKKVPRKEWELSHPFPEQKELRRLRRKMDNTFK